MAFTVDHGLDQATGVYVVTVKVDLSFSETNALFLSGDAIISWPEGELLSAPTGQRAGSTQAPDTTLVRTGMFISELGRLAPGLKIGYRQGAEAARAAQVLRLQLLRAGIEEGDLNGR